MNNPEALYIHIPFCDNICSYCDFYKMRAKPSVKSRYIAYLCKELDLYGKALASVKTLYIGGGTPLSLPPELLSKLLAKLSVYIDLKHLSEFTIEANPNDITSERLEILRLYCVSRINLGVQSFNPTKLKILNRNHNKKTVKKAMKLLKDYAFSNIGFDIIFGVGNDSYSKVKRDLNAAIKFGVTHLSVYSLIIEDKTVINHQLIQGKYQPCSDDREAEIYQKLIHYLKKKGFIHYELSNFSKPNFESRHNLVYWNNEYYFGLGAGASGYYNNIRYVNVRNLQSYFNGIDNAQLFYQERVELSVIDQMKEEMILGLRKITGIDLQQFKNKYNTDLLIAFPCIKELIEKRMLKKENNTLFIPEEKLYLSNEVLINFI